MIIFSAAIATRAVAAFLTVRRALGTGAGVSVVTRGAIKALVVLITLPATDQIAGFNDRDADVVLQLKAFPAAQANAVAQASVAVVNTAIRDTGARGRVPVVGPLTAATSGIVRAIKAAGGTLAAADQSGRIVEVISFGAGKAIASCFIAATTTENTTGIFVLIETVGSSGPGTFA